MLAGARRDPEAGQNLAEMRDYIVVTSYPAVPNEVSAQGRDAAEAYKAEAYRAKLGALAQEIQTEVIEIHGGQIIPGVRVDSDLIVRTTAEGVEALKEIQDIGRISERIDFDNLSLQADGFSNVPPGVCWSRPQ